MLATGLGKTILAAADIVHFAGTGAPSVLWITHRRELLEQAAATLRRGLPTARFAWMLAGKRPDGAFDVLFASVQSLTRTLDAFEPDRFEYVVIDEVHHADAPSYRRILDHLRPRFLLGLTATPDRADGGDGGDVPGLFDDHVAYRADIGVGIEQGIWKGCMRSVIHARQRPPHGRRTGERTPSTPGAAAAGSASRTTGSGPDSLRPTATPSRR